MKLYTEEQVITFAIKVLSDYEINGTFYNREKLKETLDVTPIELPSDEKIGEIAQWVINNRYSKHLSEDGLSKVSDFEMYHHIIKLIKEQILNQNK